MTDEHKSKIGQANSVLMKEFWKDPIYKKRMSDAHKGKPNGCLGKKRLDMVGNNFASGHRPANWKGGISKNPRMRVIYTNRRRALKYASKENISLHEWELVKAKYKYKFIACKSIRKLTIDHVVPLSRGGHDGKDNIQPLCQSCNSKKSSKIIDYRKSWTWDD